MKNFFIISGSSGSGKTTLLELLSRDLNIEISVSYTTRPPRSVSYTHLTLPTTPYL